jgi:acyl dehydratase
VAGALMGERGTIDDSTVAALERRIGIPARRRRRPHHEELTADSFRHYAMGYGDDNPVFCEPSYGRSARWGDVIAPPLYPLTAGRPIPVDWTDEQHEVMSQPDPLAGVGEYLCGERWLWSRPLVTGTGLERTACIDAAALKRSEFGGGVGVLVSNRTEWRAEDDVVCLRLTDMWHAERRGTRKSAGLRVVEPTKYAPEQLAELDRIYEAEQVRGAEVRWWDTVVVGDELGQIAKGPLTLTDILTYHIGVGWGAYGGGTGKVAYQNRSRIPALYVPNEHGVPDSVQRCHWEDAWAQQLGHPAAYDYGTMRTNWMVHLVTNWMGDDGWLWKLTASVTKFNYLGDAHVIGGRVTAVRPRDDAQGEIDVVMEGRNQRDEVTCVGTATVLLPRAGGEVSVPELDPADLPPTLEPPSDR